MARYRYFTFNQRSVLVLGVLQVACAGLCVVCGLMDAVFRKETRLSATRTPVWGGLIMAAPGVLALFASQRKNAVLRSLPYPQLVTWIRCVQERYQCPPVFPHATFYLIQVSVMVAAAGVSCAAVLVISGYAWLTLTYGEEDEEVFHHHDSPHVTFVLHRMVKGANGTILLTCAIGLALSSLIAYVGCRSLPSCGCYDARTGLEMLVPQSDPRDTEMVCTWQGAGADRLFNSPAQRTHANAPEKEEGPVDLPPYSRLA